MMPRNSRHFFTLLFISLVSFAYAQQPGAYKCLDFDGSSNYVLLSDKTALNPDTAITVEAWINADSYGSNSYDNSIFCKHGWSRGNLGYVLRCGSNGKVSFNISDANGTWREAISSSIMKTGLWYHVAGSFDGDSINVYINGKRVATTLYTGKISPSSGLTPRIGDLANGGGRLFDGKIDEVRVWQTAVDESVLRDWMCRKVSSSHPNYKLLAGYWKLDEDSGSSTIDYSGNGNTGTLTNGPKPVNSGAVLGDTSAHTYGGTSVLLRTKFKDEFAALDITRSPDCFHVVADYNTSKQANGTIDSSHYFSVFHPYDTALRYTISYDFGDKVGLSADDKCAIDLYAKPIGNTGTWAQAGAAYHQKGDSLTLTNQTIREIGLTSYPTDSNALIKSSTGRFTMCGSDKIDLIAIGNDSFSYEWYQDGNLIKSATSSRLSVDSVAKYYVKITRNNSTCTFKSASVSVNRISKPKVTLSALNGVCESVDTINLSGGAPKGGTYSGLSVKGAVFYPSLVKSGTYTITYSYIDTNKCTGSATQDQVVYGLPSFNKGQMEYCNDKDSVNLTKEITPTGGQYIGKYFSNGYFHIDSANRLSKFYTFTYAYTDKNGCYNDMVDSLEIKWATPVSFAKVNQLCAGDDSVQLKGTPSTGEFAGKGVNKNYFHPKIAGVGNHLLSYSFTNLLNCTTTDTQTVVVIANSKVTWNESVKPCVNGDTMHLKEGVPSGGFFKGTGLDSFGVFNPKIAGAGQHLLNYVTLDGNGCYNKAQIVASVDDTSAISFGNIDPVCLISEPELLTVAMPSGGSYSGLGVTNDTFASMTAGVGTHTMQYAYTNVANCVSTSNFDLEVLKPDSVSISAKSELCVTDDPVVLSRYPSGGTTTGKGIIGSVFSPSISGAGNHLLQYEIVGSGGCKAIDSLWIFVSETPVVSITPMASMCEKDEAIELMNGMPVDSGEYTVNGASASKFDPKTLGVGLHHVQYKVVNAIGCMDSASTSIRVNANPSKPIVTWQKNELKSTATKGNQWYNTSGAISGETNAIFNPTTDGTYWTVVTNDSGCTATSDSTEFKYVGIATVLPEWLKVGPNPTHDNVIITSKQPIQGIILLDVQGREIGRQAEVGGNATLPLKDVPMGMYTAIVTIDNLQYVIRLVKN